MKIQLYSDIVNEQERVWCEWEGNQDAVSFNSIQKLLATRGEEDKQIELVINCKGGDCIEGWAIYDLLRQQTGCEIFATIEGECSSMASIILLAAPLENRKAYANAHLCIHNPAVCWFDTDYYERLTAENVRKTAEKILNQASSLQTEQDKILATYVERTGTDPETLQNLMNQDIYINMEKAQELGFISGTFAPTTAHKDARFKAYNFNPINKNNMSKTNAKATALESVFTAIKKLVGIEDAPAMKALEVTDVDGNVLTIEREEGDPQVGDVASPDGTYVLEDGTTINVEGGQITAITPPAEEETPEETPEDSTEDKKKKPCAEGEEETPEEQQPSVEELQQQIAELKQQIQTLNEQIQTLTENQTSTEDAEILQMVAKAGGKDRVQKALTARSTFNANNTKVVDRKPEEQQPEAFGSSYLEAKRKEHEEALKKLRK